MAPRWWRRSRRPHVSELVDVEVVVDGQQVLMTSLESLALATKYGGGITDLLPTFSSWTSPKHVAISTRYRDTPTAP